ncbi:uncharacterized protein LOC110097463, partial [Dendrobium catenatum]|uniref:uncharacterized protein LOC110097463 n=1 Tax=Dendrobium catenatum TaxID=906689 RepID=UPI0010A03B4C
MAGLCFRCGQPGHRIAECPHTGFDWRSEFRSEGFVRPADSAAGRPRTGEPSSSVASAPAPVQPRVYSLSQQEARDAPDVVTGTIYIFDQPYRVLFDSGASHSFLSEWCLEALCLDSILLLVSLSVILPTGSNLIAHKFCFCEIEISDKKWKSSLILLPISSYDVILGMDWLSLYEAQIDCSKKQVRRMWKKGCLVFLASVWDLNLEVGSVSEITV